MKRLGLGTKATGTDSFKECLGHDGKGSNRRIWQQDDGAKGDGERPIAVKIGQRQNRSQATDNGTTPRMLWKSGKGFRERGERYG
ncbi:Uncharacterized protein TCM_007978 [Theobroma cacao]|uniref:Uncharacterized protein n=1 Tax=Theobroma cacao TaxID=3641 RepID=A0A061EAN5_THECC|nr:Uncharacterized protein TCM_007978 [Theobroma cacao]